jgi:hypothetical protein
VDGTAVLEVGAELGRANRWVDAAIERGAGARVQHEPGLALHEAVRVPGRIRRVGVHLHRERLVGIQELDQQREIAVRGGSGSAEHQIALAAHDVLERAAGAVASGDRRGPVVDRGRQVRQQPRLTDRGGRFRKRQERADARTAPDAVLQQRPQDDGQHEGIRSPCR